MKKPKIIVIGGPTATGKSNLAVSLAQKFNGEVISADSRQVYRGLTIGTGKITKKEMSGVHHYLLDIRNPKNKFSVLLFQKKGREAIKKILKKEKVPIICGGTGFYIHSLVYNTTIPDVMPNNALRKKLKKLSTEKLFTILKKKDPARAKTIDKHNNQRLIRALEIVEALGKVPKKKEQSHYDVFFIGLQASDLNKKIHLRLLARLKSGMIQEAKTLHQNGLSYSRMEELGLEYKYLSKLLKKEITKKYFMEHLEKEIKNYSKRQLTWFKKEKGIRWFNTSGKKQLLKEVGMFLK